MREWDTVAIVGVGLIGGSIGLALQQRGLARRVVGVGRRASSLRKARQCAARSPTPRRSLERGRGRRRLGDRVHAGRRTSSTTSARWPGIVRRGALITDVGSTKSRIVRELDRRLRGSPAFVGKSSHGGQREDRAGECAGRSAGESRDGGHAHPAHALRRTLQQIEQFWTSLGARVVRMTPQDHDQAVAMTSHATHVIAVGAGRRHAGAGACRWPPAAGGIRPGSPPAIRSCGSRFCWRIARRS